MGDGSQRCRRLRQQRKRAGQQPLWIERRHRTPRLQPGQQFADPALVPAQYGATDGEGLDHGAPERFRFARELQHKVAGSVGIGDRGNRRREGHDPVHAEPCCLPLHLGDVGLAAGFARARQPQACVATAVGTQ